MVENKLLEQLVAFAEYGTLCAVSERLYISQPTLTRCMKTLEEELGVILFHRSKNRLSLNETGIHAANFAKQLLLAHQEFEKKVKAYDRSLHTISIGFCAPTPQTVFIPLINTLFNGMSISFDMTDDRFFEERLLQGVYQLAVMHNKPQDVNLYYKKCGSENLYISLPYTHPLSSCQQIHLKDLDGLSILLLSNIGFWADIPSSKAPKAKYLLQIDYSSFIELADHSEYPVFSSNYLISHGNLPPARKNIPLADPECHVDYYLVCLNSEKKKYDALFSLINENTIKK